MKTNGQSEQTTKKAWIFALYSHSIIKLINEDPKIRELVVLSTY